jgi:uncharacterized membrane protein
MIRKHCRYWLLSAILCVSLFSIFSFSAADSPLTVTSTEKTLKVVNGQSVTLHVTAVNTSNTEMSAVNVQIDLPYKWIIQSMAPESLTLSPGESGEFSIQLAVPSSENASTHTLNVSCKSGDITSDIINIPVAVVTNPLYGYVILGSIALMVAATILYLRRGIRR